MSHARSGLPPLNLEPFDATPLWAAARSPRPDQRQPRHRGGRHPVVLGLTIVLLLALVLGGVAAFVLR